MKFHSEFSPFPVRVLLWWSPLASSWVKLFAREFFDPCICSLEKENWLSHNCWRRSCPYACIFDKFFFTKPSIPLQSVRIRKGFVAKKIKNFSIPYDCKDFVFHCRIIAFSFIKASPAIFAEFFSFFNFEDCTPVLIAGICLQSQIILFIRQVKNRKIFAYLLKILHNLCFTRSLRPTYFFLEFLL